MVQVIQVEQNNSEHIDNDNLIGWEYMISSDDNVVNYENVFNITL